MRGGNALLVVLVGALALAAAGCGAKPSYRERAQDACAQASPRTAADAARTARDARAGLVALRRAKLPESGAQRLTAQRLVANAGEQQQALDRLAAGLRANAAPATLRDLADRVIQDGTLVRSSAQALGAPACGAAATAVATEVHAQDYAATVQRAAGQLAIVQRRLPRLGGSDHVRLIADAEYAADAFDDLAAHLEPLEPPRAAAAQHGRLLGDLYRLRDGYTSIADRHGAHLAGALAARTKDYNKAQVDWHALAAKLPRVPATGSPWGPTDGRRQADADLRKAYIKTMDDELFGLNVDLPGGHTPTVAKLRAIARLCGHAHSRLVDLRTPADAASTQRLMLSGIADLGHAASVLLAHRTLAGAEQAQHLALRSIDRLRRAQRSFRAAGYHFDLGVRSSGRGGSGGGGSGSSAPSNSTLA